MTTVIGGSAPSITFSDSTTQSTAALPLTGGSVSADITVHGLTVGLGGGSVSSATAVGNGALAATNTGSNNSAFGLQALTANTSGYNNTGLGYVALNSNNTGYSNTGVGNYSLLSNSSGNSNTAVGDNALRSNTTASNNTAVGYQAGYTNSTGAYNTFLGYQAGYTSNIGNSSCNTCIGTQAGYSLTTGYGNCFIGSGAVNSGYYVTTGNYNTILGGFTGNQGGLDIRTANNYIVLSDGAGNPRGFFDNNGSYVIGANSPDSGSSSAYYSGFGFVNKGTTNNYMVVGHPSGTSSGNGYHVFTYNGTIIGSITQSGTTAVLYNTTSDYRLKTNVQPVTTGLSIVSQLNPVNFTWVADNEADTGFLAHEFQAVIPRAVTGAKDAVDADGNPVYQQMDNSGAIPYLVAAIKELKAEFDAYKATHP